MTAEMIKLRQMLDKANIEWIDRSEPEGFYAITRTHFWYRKYHWSVVHGFGTYGGYSFNHDDYGLLELMSDAVNESNPIGWLTAEDVMKYVTGEWREAR